jgi:hypothetical protein
MSWIITGTQKYETDPYRNNVSLLLHGNADGSGNILDSSPSPKTITKFGDTTSTIPPSYPNGNSTFGNALYFDGNGDYLQAVDDAMRLGSSDFTIEFWVYFPTGFTFLQGASPLYIGGTNNIIFSPFSIRDSAGSVVSYINGQNSPAWNIAANVPFTTIVRDTWLHWSITRNGSNWYTFENGQIKSQFTSAESVYDPGGDNGRTLLLGRAYTDGVKDVLCYIDEFRLTQGVARYTSNFTPPTAPFPDI